MKRWKAFLVIVELRQVIEEKLGHKINHKKIYRLMDITKLECVIHKKKKYKRFVPQHVAENIVNRNFKAEKTNGKWVWTNEIILGNP